MTENKKKARTIYILESCLDRIILDAVVSFPQGGEPVDILTWGRIMHNMIIEAVKRKDVPAQAYYKDLSFEAKVEKVLNLARAKVADDLKKEERKASAEMYLSLKPVGPPPIKPEEKVDEEEDSDAEYHPEPVLREPAPERPRPDDDDDGFIKREDGAYEWDGSEPD